MNNKKSGDKVVRFNTRACYTIKFKSCIIHMFFRRWTGEGESGRRGDGETGRKGERV